MILFASLSSKCSNNLKVEIPFIARSRRGLLAKECACGSDEVPFSYIDLDYDNINLNFFCKLTENSKDEVFEEKDSKVRPKLKLLDTSCC